MVGLQADEMKLRELITDPSAGQLSMSRLMPPVVVALDGAWVAAVVLGMPPATAVSPVSSMLGVVTGAVCGVYGLSTVKGGGGIIETIKRQVFKPAK